MIPYATCAIDAIRITESEDAYGTATESVLASGVRAVLSEPAGTLVSTMSGNVSTTRRKLTCDPIDLRAGDIVVSNNTEYVVQSSDEVLGPLPHTSAWLAIRER